MNLFSISWKNILHKPTSVVLSLVLFALGVGLIAFLLQVDKQVQQNLKTIWQVSIWLLGRKVALYN
jgi:hypothetical protein